MERLEDAIMNWVNSTQVNSFQSGTSRILSDLCDGIFFFDLMSSISAEYFDKDIVIREIENKASLRFVNLRSLKKALHMYMDEELHVSSSPFTLINLRSIAFENNSEELLKLIEMVLCAVINCPKNEDFINKLRKLDEHTQKVLKVLIEKSMSSQPLEPIELNDSSGEEDEFIERKKYETIKEEKIKMLETIEELQIENHKLNSLVEDLKYRSPPAERYTEEFRVDRECMDLAEINTQLENQVVKLSIAIQKEREEFDDIKKQLKNEISHLEDDLDIAKAQVSSFDELNKRVDYYKKKMNDIESLKVKIKEKEKKIERVEKEVSDRDIRLSKYIRYKREFEEINIQHQSLTGQLENFKQKLVYKDNELNTAVFNNQILKRKLDEANATIIKLESEQFPSQESSFRSLQSQNSLNVLEKGPQNLKLQFECLEEELEALKKKKKNLKLNHMMRIEDCRSVICSLSAKEAQTTEENIVIQQTLDKTKKKLMKYESQVFEIEDLTYRNEELMVSMNKTQENYEEICVKYDISKQENRSLNEQIRKLKEENSSLKANDNVKQVTIDSLNADKKALDELILSLEKSDNNNIDFRIVSLQNENQKFFSKISTLKAKLKDTRSLVIEKDSLVEESRKQTEEDHQHTISKIKHQYEQQIKDIQEENISALATIVKKQEFLQYGRSEASEQTFKVYQAKLINSAEDLKAKDEEIECLISANKELKREWKEATALLESVWMELRTETAKLNKIVYAKQSKL